jgi:hypothetical protein
VREVKKRAPTPTPAAPRGWRLIKKFYKIFLSLINAINDDKRLDLSSMNAIDDTLLNH